jgi:hypothetical protein
MPTPSQDYLSLDDSDAYRPEIAKRLATAHEPSSVPRPIKLKVHDRLQPISYGQTSGIL